VKRASVGVAYSLNIQQVSQLNRNVVYSLDSVNTPVSSGIKPTQEPLLEDRVSPTSERCVVHDLKKCILRTSSCHKGVRSTTHKILKDALEEKLLAFHITDESLISLTEAYILREVLGTFLILLESKYCNWLHGEDEASDLHN